MGSHTWVDSTFLVDIGWYFASFLGCRFWCKYCYGENHHTIIHLYWMIPGAWLRSQKKKLGHDYSGLQKLVDQLANFSLARPRYIWNLKYQFLNRVLPFECVFYNSWILHASFTYFWVMSLRCFYTGNATVSCNGDGRYVGPTYHLGDLWANVTFAVRVCSYWTGIHDLDCFSVLWL